MLSFLLLRALFVSLLLGVAASDLYYGEFSLWNYLLLILIYSAVLSYGSAYIASNVFIKTICRSKSKKKELAFTFDDGPAGESTERVLEILERNQIQAAFFCIGSKMVKNEAQIKAIDSRGHLIGNHSFSHSNFFDLFSTKRIKKELEDTNQIAEKILSKQLRLFRPPYGVTTPNIARAVKSLGLLTIGWSLRTMDTVINKDEKLLNKVVNRVKGGDIILFHDTSTVTVNSLQRFIDVLKAKGYTIVRLDKLLNIEAYA